MKKINFRHLAKDSAKVFISKKCKKVIILNVRRLTTICNYFVIATVESTIQMNSVFDFIVSSFKKNGISQIYRPQIYNRSISEQWRTIDYGGVVIHLMTPQARGFYSLERIWYKAKIVKHDQKRNKKRNKKITKLTRKF